MRGGKWSCLLVTRGDTDLAVYADKRGKTTPGVSLVCHG